MDPVASFSDYVILVVVLLVVGYCIGWVAGREKKKGDWV